MQLYMALDGMVTIVASRQHLRIDCGADACLQAHLSEHEDTATTISKKRYLAESLLRKASPLCWQEVRGRGAPEPSLSA